jgi:hypothetical protein
MRLSLIFASIAFSLQAIAQSGFYVSNNLVFDLGNELKFSATGGFDNPQFSEIDLNDDGVKDLFVFDRKHDVVRTFTYNTVLQDYEYAPQYERQFPSGLHDFVLLRDINCDGHEDLFTFFQGGFRLYQNEGTSPLTFTLRASKIQTKYGNINTSAFVLAGDLPAIVDTDNDGDLDILTFGTVNSENTIEFNQNLSMETYGTCDSLLFEVKTQCWGNVMEPANAANFEAVSCRGVISPPIPSERDGIHPGSSVLLIDLDNDGDKDLITGDIATKTLLKAINVGDSVSANIDVNQQSHDFPNVSDAANMPYLVTGFEIDVDHDGIQDLVLSVNNGIDSSANSGHVWYYRNTSPTVPNYELVTKNFLLENMVDFGSSTAPAVMDINGDGLKDILLAVDYKRTSSTSVEGSRIYAFTQNSSGTFEINSNNYANLSLFGLSSISPTLGDLDGDGDLDMIVGGGDGYLHLVKNNGTATQPNFAFSVPNYMDINTIGSNAAPTLADINDDGLLDLVIGERTGILSYFENEGTASNAQFTSSPTIDSFGQIDISFYCCTGFSVPRILDNEAAFGPGKFILVGSSEKDMEVYRIPNDLEADFVRVDSIPLNSGKLAPIVVDIDDDGIFEILSGTGEGGLKMLDRDGNYPFSISNISNLKTFNLYPNPTSNSIFVSGLDQGSDYRIISLMGAVLKSGSISNSDEEISLNQIPSGHYFMQVEGYAPMAIVVLK